MCISLIFPKYVNLASLYVILLMFSLEPFSVSQETLSGVTHEWDMKNLYDTAPPGFVSLVHAPLQHTCRPPETPCSVFCNHSLVYNVHLRPLHLSPQRSFTAHHPPLQGWVSCPCIQLPPIEPCAIPSTRALNPLLRNKPFVSLLY